MRRAVRLSRFLGLLLSGVLISQSLLAAQAVLVLPEFRAGNNKSVAPKGASILINAPARQLFLLDSAQRVIKTYPVGVGRPGFATPAGNFKIVRMVKQPGFENPYKPAGASRIAPGAGNPLGTRWMGFHPVASGEYGIHGTNRPESVGQFSSHGCVRMYVKDAEDLFERVAFGTPVTVSYDRTLVLTKADGVFLTVAPDPFSKSNRGSIGQVKNALASFFPKAEINASALTNGLTQPSATQLKIGTLPDPDEYNKIVETSVMARIPGKDVSVTKEASTEKKHTDY